MLKKIAPEFVVRLYMFCQTFLYDAYRMFRYGFLYSDNLDNKKARLMMSLHILEKGMAMPNMRLGFGKENILRICDYISEIQKIESLSYELNYARSLLKEYISLHNGRGYTLPIDICEKISKIENYPPQSAKQLTTSAQLHFSASDYFGSGGNMDSWMLSRHSVRNYKNTPIPESVFRDVAIVANAAPSSCNRQTCRMHIITDQEHVREVLSLQGGCRGFGHLAPAAIIVTSDLLYFRDVQERLQPAINSGFFGMNILYALHSRGIGCCVLNWAYTKKRDRQLRKVVSSIKDSEQIEFMICCGYPPDEFDVALSRRKPIESCICFVDKDNHVYDTVSESKQDYI